ncbi:MAG: pyruvate kinase alpha/beta domain-containing protein [Nitrospirota bacterium]
MIERKVLYFEKPGKVNTQACLDVVRRVVQEDGFKNVVLASTTGDTGLMFAEGLKGGGANLIVVTHSAGFKEPNSLEMAAETRKKILDSGATVYTGSMPTHSLDTAFSTKFSGSHVSQILAQALRRFGEGTKVCCEIVMMATDSGLIPEGSETLAVAGTARGADTVAVLKSAASKRFFDLRVLEFLAKPRNL